MKKGIVFSHKRHPCSIGYTQKFSCYSLTWSNLTNLSKHICLLGRWRHLPCPSVFVLKETEYSPCKICRRKGKFDFSVLITYYPVIKQLFGCCFLSPHLSSSVLLSWTKQTSTFCTPSSFQPLIFFSISLPSCPPSLFMLWWSKGWCYWMYTIQQI